MTRWDSPPERSRLRLRLRIYRRRISFLHLTLAAAEMISVGMLDIVSQIWTNKQKRYVILREKGKGREGERVRIS